MKTLTLFLALGFAAAAQTTSNVSGVTLTGPVAHPTIKNHSGKSVLWLRWKRSITEDTDSREGGQWFIDQAGGLPDGSSAELGRYNSKNTVTSATITAVIFGDGEFRGEDGHGFRSDMERRFQTMRELFQMAQAGEWDKLKAKVDAEAKANLKGEGIDSFGAVTAQRLLQTHGAGLEYYGLLPASTWTGGQR